MGFREWYSEYKREIATAGMSIAVLTLATFLATRPSKLETITQKTAEQLPRCPNENIRTRGQPEIIIGEYASDVIGTGDLIQSMQMPALKTLEWKELAEQYGLDRKPDFNREYETIPGIHYNK
jgi:hypothetical protein